MFTKIERSPHGSDRHLLRLAVQQASVSVVLERKTRKIYKNHEKSPEDWDLFDDDDDESGWSSFEDDNN